MALWALDDRRHEIRVQATATLREVLRGLAPEEQPEELMRGHPS